MREWEGDVKRKGKNGRKEKGKEKKQQQELEEQKEGDKTEWAGIHLLQYRNNRWIGSLKVV